MPRHRDSRGLIDGPRCRLPSALGPKGPIQSLVSCRTASSSVTTNSGRPASNLSPIIEPADLRLGRNLLRLVTRSCDAPGPRLQLHPQKRTPGSSATSTSPMAAAAAGRRPSRTPRQDVCCPGGEGTNNHCCGGIATTASRHRGGSGGQRLFGRRSSLPNSKGWLLALAAAARSATTSPDF